MIPIIMVCVAWLKICLILLNFLQFMVQQPQKSTCGKQKVTLTNAHGNQVEVVPLSKGYGVVDHCASCKVRQL